ncbi:MAG: 3-dehydroquinate synthase [Gammaproteobacteria bacterium]|nr:3-dehydroquinate synthase [Gammaproteobacteria bacterium]
MIQFDVDLGARSYPIHIGQHVIEPFLADAISGDTALVVTDEHVAPLFLNKVLSQLEHLKTDSVVLPAGEQHKNLTTLTTIFDRLLERRFDRHTTLIALGGGVVGDMTGFAAACYQRGVDFIQIPTTLLSQVDSSVGGKTGVNHPLGKNMIGAFHQPQCVLIDTDSLCSLPPREYKAGMAEVIKYGLINDRPFFDWLVTHHDALMEGNLNLLAEAIERSCRNKAKIVAKDERESGVRALLNLGHTFGHAIEAGLGYGKWLHGEAVAAGMSMAAHFSQQLGLLDKEAVQQVDALLEHTGLPRLPPAGMSTQVFLSLMSADKKARRGVINLILLKNIGEAFVCSDYPSAELELFLDRYLSSQ